MNAGTQLCSFLSILRPQLLNEENVVHIHKGVVWSHTDRGNQAIWKNTDGNENDDAKLKRSDAEKQILHASSMKNL